MASRKTVCRTGKIVSRLTQIFGPELHAPFPVMFNRKGKIITKWEGTGPLVEARKKGPGTFERIYQQLPRETLLRFIIPTRAPMAEPTEREWQEFETKFLITARRAIIRQVRKQFQRLSKGLPEPAKRKRGRPKRKEARVKMIQETIERWLDSGKYKTKTEAVEEARRLFGDGKVSLHRDTIWRYLRAARHAGPSSASPSSR